MRVVFPELVIFYGRARRPTWMGSAVDVRPVENGQSAVPEVGGSAHAAASGKGHLDICSLPNFALGKQGHWCVAVFHQSNGMPFGRQHRTHDAPCQTATHYAYRSFHVD